MAAAVRHRLVFYCHGYDPEAGTRYRRLFVTAFSQLSRRFGVERTIGPLAHDAAVPAARWSVTAAGPGWRTETTYEVLRWDDLVQRDFARPWRRRAPLLLGAMTEALRSGVLPRLFRLNLYFALFVLYPWIAALALVAAAVALGWALASALSAALPLPLAAGSVVAVLVAVAALRAAGPRLRRAYVFHLLDGWIFSWQQAAGHHRDIDVRLDRFARHIVETVRRNAADEVLIVGHSTGSTLAVEIAARALAYDPDLARTAPLRLLTIGSCLPIVGFVRTADRLREAVAALATSPALLWVEYQAPQDALNAFGFDPVRDLKLEIDASDRTNPVIRSARFKETLSPPTYRRIRWNFFRMHFHFLMANEVPGEYDYLMIACGPVPLADRIADPLRAVRTAYGAEAAPASPAGHAVPPSDGDAAAAANGRDAA